MNKSKINFLVVAVVLLVPYLAFALPGAHDPSGGFPFNCASCHSAPSTMGNLDSNYSTNVCLKCHSTTGTMTGYTQKNFAPEDYSNPFGTTGLTRSTKIQSSHKWFGSDTVAPAGALPPVDTSLNGLNKNANFVSGGLFCARCHNVHGTSGDSSVDSPYLRYPNDSDQLCLNCHRPRDTQDHTVGTHPVNLPYSSASNVAKRSASGNLLSKPATNPTNPTAVVKLVNGKIVCSTCHRMHNTDSNSATFDPYSSTHTFNKMSSSSGYLLRVSPYGKTNPDLNICNNCHTNRKNHNLGLRNGKAIVQCVDCHSGHVEYDAAAAGIPAEQVPNVYLVRRYLQYSTAGRINKRILYRSTTTKEYYNATGNGVCQACHKPPTTHYSGNSYAGSFPEAGHVDCTGCHVHTETSGSFSYGAGNCTNSCHGLPPVATSGTNGPASGYSRFDEGTSPHKSHAAGGGPNANDFDCNECHAGYTMPNGNFGEVFLSPAGTIAAKNGAVPTYIYATATCQNVYCHSNGRGIWKTGMNNIQWGSNKQGSIIGKPTECITCHDDPNSSASHTRHVSTTNGMGYGCVTCHNTTVSDNTTLLASAKVVGGTHTNGVKNIGFVGTGAAVGTTCANIKCHSNGKGAAPNVTPSWGVSASGTCGACHWTQTTSTVLATGSHTKHYLQFGTNNPTTVCAACHIYTAETAATHVNGTLDVTSGCSTCHADPYSSNVTTPTWGTSSPGCGACHSGAGAFVGTGSGPATGAHNKHMAITSYTVNCATCHTGAVAGSNGGTAHQDGNIDVAVTGYPVNITKHSSSNFVGTCSTLCHSTSSTANTTPSWGATATCNTCHQSVPTTGSHSKHVAAPGVSCADCHTGAVVNSNGGTGHYDGGINVAVSGYPANVTKHAAGVFGTSTCSTLCHSTSNAAVATPTWGAVGTCATCHVVSPVTGAHTRHIAAGASCGQCHTGAVLNSNGGTGHFDGNINVAAGMGYPVNVAKHAVGVFGANTCSTASCHATTVAFTLNWGNSSANDFCTKCHGTGTATVTAGNRYVVAPSGSAADTGQVSSNTTIGAHQTHLRFFNGFSNYSTVDYRCEACHGTLPAANTFTHAGNGSTPVGKFQTLATKWGARTPTYTNGGTCNNTYCHNPAGAGGTLTAGNEGTNTAPSWTASAYIADGTRKTLTNCNKCHKVPGEAGFQGISHGSVTIADSCVGCHGHEGDSQGAVGKRHMDGIKYGNGSCNSCHGYPPLSPADFAAKGANFVDAQVENYTGGGGHHAIHLSGSITQANAFTPCLPCHPDSAKGYHNAGNGSVIKANVTIFDATDTGYRFDSKRVKRYNTANMTCSNVSCHFQPTTVW